MFVFFRYQNEVSVIFRFRSWGQLNLTLKLESDAGILYYQNLNLTLESESESESNANFILFFVFFVRTTWATIFLDGACVKQFENFDSKKIKRTSSWNVLWMFLVKFFFMYDNYCDQIKYSSKIYAVTSFRIVEALN